LRTSGVKKRYALSAVDIFKADAKSLGLGLREYCRQFGIEYESLLGMERTDPVTKHEHRDYRTCNICKTNSVINGRSSEDTND
jgi:hypothetical protein